MVQLKLQVVVILVSVVRLSSTTASSCEETETAHVKLDLAKQSILDAKLHYPKCENETNESNCTIKDKALAHLNAALDLISEAKITCHSCPDGKIIVPQDQPIDCSDIRSNGVKKNGVYQIWPKGYGVNSNKSIDVYCDMETDGGGWTVIQRRGNFSKRTDFSKGWNEYKNGFGDIKQEFWLGNDKIHTISNQGVYSLRFDLVDVRHEYRYAEYTSFSIGNEESGYVLLFDKHKGNASDDLRDNYYRKFSTKDRTNDGRNSPCIGENNRSAFWFTSYCGPVNLNGIYQPGVKDEKGIWWYSLTRDMECLLAVEIKIRRDFTLLQLLLADEV